MSLTPLAAAIQKNQHVFHKVVPFEAGQNKLHAFDFTISNTALTPAIINNTDAFSNYITQTLQATNASFGIGGYNEHRELYKRSTHFNTTETGEPRRLHLGIDIWGPPGTPIYAPMGGMVHSFGYNNEYGDYGATIILMHQLDGLAFYTLYGHLSLSDISVLSEGNYISIGQEFAHFGAPEENGQWPPHLHFQIIEMLEWKKGDYPGVCKLSEKDKYLLNCPNPDLILQMMQYAV
jgi:peptidoglycan LD-endopeptidase LytH